MQVSISKAADMIGITRATLYRHIEKKGISVNQDEEGNPKIDVSELIRVYGNRVKIANDTQEDSTDKTARIIHVEQGNTPSKTPSTGIELEVLRERVKHLEESKNKSEDERKRERTQFEERIEQLQETLNKSQENQNKTTLLLEHYTKEGAGGDWQKSLKALEERIANQEASIQEKIAIEAEKAAKEVKKNEELQMQLEEKEKILAEKEEALKLEKSKSFLHKLFRA